MSITREEIAAFADGELSGEREAEIAAAMKADIRLAEQVDRHRALKTMLASHYAPIVDQPVPGRLAGLLAEPPRPEVVDMAAAREKREARRLPRWGWIAGPALAASLAFALLLPNASDNPTAYADAQLAAVLEDRLVATQSPAEETRILLSFRSKEGRYCRAFSGTAGGGIACRDEEGWRLEALGGSSEGASTDYRMAGAEDRKILALAQEMASGTALDAEGETAARTRGWR